MLEDTYVALSYTWGDRNPRHQVICEETERHESPSSDGKGQLLIVVHEDTIDISPNLYDFLSELRNDSDQMLWADQICINQNDLEERKNQVALMGRIYAEAQFVIIWLSKALWVARDVIHDIQEFYNFFYDMHSKSLGERYDAEQTLSPTIWPSLYRVFSQAYFQRVWIIQEVIKAKEASVMIGGGTMAFDVLASINFYLQNRLQSQRLFPPDFRLCKCAHPYDTDGDGFR
jgi:hypothetical protein